MWTTKNEITPHVNLTFPPIICSIYKWLKIYRCRQGSLNHIKSAFSNVNYTFIHLFSHVNKKRQHEKNKWLSLESVDFTFPHNTNVNVRMWNWPGTKPGAPTIKRFKLNSSFYATGCLWANFCISFRRNTP